MDLHVLVVKYQLRVGTSIQVSTSIRCIYKVGNRYTDLQYMQYVYQAGM